MYVHYFRKLLINPCLHLNNNKTKQKHTQQQQPKKSEGGYSLDFFLLSRGRFDSDGEVKKSKEKEQKLVCLYLSRASSGETRSVAHVSLSQRDYLAHFSPLWSMVNAIFTSHACNRNSLSPHSPKWMPGLSFSRVLLTMGENIFFYFGTGFSSTHILLQLLQEPFY